MDQNLLIKTWKSLPKIKGIKHQTTCPEIPQRNMISERKNRHILNITRSIIFKINVPCKFWPQTVACTCHLMNRTPSIGLKGKGPFEIIRGKSVSIERLKVFRCKCYVHIQDNQRNKFQARAVRFIFLGYPQEKKDIYILTP